MLKFHIDPELCIQCGACAADCPAQIITMNELPEITDESRCYRCQHCYAVCPTGALSILGHTPADQGGLKPNLPSAAQMRDLVTWRRSVRSYKPENVDPALIDSLLDMACTAPTGVNARSVHFTVIRDRAFLSEFRQNILDRLARLAEAGKLPEGLPGQYLGYALNAWKTAGQDVIFRGAPHLLVVSAPPTQLSPVQDAHIALTTFDLLASANGLGTVWDGIFMMILREFPDLLQTLRIPDDHTLGYAIAFGIPDVTYHRPVTRGPASVTFLE